MHASITEMVAEFRSASLQHQEFFHATASFPKEGDRQPLDDFGNHVTELALRSIRRNTFSVGEEGPSLCRLYRCGDDSNCELEYVYGTFAAKQEYKILAREAWTLLPVPSRRPEPIMSLYTDPAAFFARDGADYWTGFVYRTLRPYEHIVSCRLDLSPPHIYLRENLFLASADAITLTLQPRSADFESVAGRLKATMWDILQALDEADGEPLKRDALARRATGGDDTRAFQSNVERLKALDLIGGDGPGRGSRGYWLRNHGRDLLRYRQNCADDSGE